MNEHELRFGLRVVTEQGREGTVTHIHTGSLAGAVDVTLDDGRYTVERGHTLRRAGARTFTCGCCTAGCCCRLHCDIPRGLLPRKCGHHTEGGAS